MTAADPTPASAGPLAGYKVLEICSTIAGPACARLLADFGADVIKIEPPGGDSLRSMGKHVGEVSLYAATLLRNKRSAAIDLKQPRGRALVRRLADRTDVLVENQRPGVLERLGLGYEELASTNPGLVMVRISGYGQTGPYAQRPGYGAICEALAGVRHMTGDPDRPPARVALATTDYLTAVYAAFGATMALIERARSGKGQIVDAALYEAAFTQMEAYVAAYEKLGYVPARVGSSMPTMAPNSLYPTQDGAFVLIAANSDPTFRRLAEAMGRPELLDDPRFCSIRARSGNLEACNASVAEWTRRHDGAEIECRLIAAEVPVSRVFTIADIYRDPHFAAREMLIRVPHPALGHTTQQGVVPRLSSTPGRVARSGPELGEDTRDVLAGELGITDAELDRLIADRVIVGIAPPVPAASERGDADA